MRSRGWSMKTLAAPDTAPLARCHAAGSCALTGAASDETGGSKEVVAAADDMKMR